MTVEETRLRKWTSRDGYYRVELVEVTPGYFELSLGTDGEYRKPPVGITVFQARSLFLLLADVLTEKGVDSRCQTQQ